MAKFDKAFVTGCDKYTEWMLEWFVKNYKKHNDTPLIFCDFGISKEMVEFVNTEFDGVVDMTRTKKRDGIAWWLKPAAIRLSDNYAHNRVWLDTDCEVLDNLDEIWEYILPNKLTIAIDRPWNKHRPGKWYNSGVVGVQGIPSTLVSWEMNCHTMHIPIDPKLPPPGDQDVIMKMLQDNPINEVGIHELPNRYNVLRIQLVHNDKPEEPKVIHWTGYKGKLHIEEQIRYERSSSDR